MQPMAMNKAMYDTLPTAAATNAAPAAAESNGSEEVSDPAYLNTVRTAVARHLRYPELALRRGVEA